MPLGGATSTNIGTSGAQRRAPYGGRGGHTRRSQLHAGATVAIAIGFSVVVGNESTMTKIVVDGSSRTGHVRGVGLVQRRQ
jgi:hypothetical protein